MNNIEGVEKRRRSIQTRRHKTQSTIENTTRAPLADLTNLKNLRVTTAAKRKV
jgi:hypothetical protein